MGLLNPSFEDAGAAPGEAAHWTFTTFCSTERIAGFGPARARAWEDFECWFALHAAFVAGDVALAFFDPLAEGLEDFEEAWDNDHFLLGLPTGQIEAALFDGAAVEPFEGGWANASYATAWEQVSGIVGVFDAEPREDFEEQWAANQAFAWTWVSVTSAVAVFAGGAAAETFNADWTPATTI